MLITKQKLSHGCRDAFLFPFEATKKKVLYCIGWRYMDHHKSVTKNLFSKIKDNDNGYRLKKFSSFIGYILVIVLVTVVLSDKLGALTVALDVAGASIAFGLQEVIAFFAGWLAMRYFDYCN